LAGFLGVGKTSCLKHFLENKKGLKLGVVVNDVASINIDSKLLMGDTEGASILELQNGCVCCSIADELFTSVQRICSNRELDAVVVECEFNLCYT
jgi:G3E family GTPase